MNITADQAEVLLANQSEKDLRWKADWNFTDRTAAIVREDDPSEEVMEVLFKGDDTAFSDGDLALAAAAPDLARTVIDQAEEIDRKKQALNTYGGVISTLTRDLAKAIGHEDLLDEDGAHNQDIYEIAFEMIHEARAAREADQ